MRNIEAVKKQFVDNVRRFASVHELLVCGGKYIIALSGGADSVSLLLVMRELSDVLGIKIEAAHCNFHLRGAESMRDEDFCRGLCDRLCVPFHVIHFATKDYADLHHVSIEMAARELRYQYFERLRHDINADDVCVAHHRDDSVETVILNLVRGTGIRGLRGIQPRHGHIVRPLLSVSRDEIIGYLDCLRQDFVTDSTNLVDDVKRNKVRLNVLPLLKSLNPSVSKAVFETSLRMNEAFKVFDRAVDESAHEVMSLSDGKSVDDDNVAVPIIIDVDKLFLQPSAESTLFYILGSRNFSSSQIDDVYDMLVAERTKGNAVNVSGKTMTSATHELLFNRGCIMIQPLNYGVSKRQMRIPEIGMYVYSENLKLAVKEENKTDGYVPSHERSCVCVDAEKLLFPLCLRPLNNGERFVPFGMSKSKLVSDFLTNRKRSLFDKRRQLVVADADNRIIWLVNEQIDNRCRVTDKSRRILRLAVVAVD